MTTAGGVIDDRIVQMEFDNKEFEKNIGETLDSLDKFDESLKNLDKTDFGDGITKGFGDIQDSIDSTTFDSIGDGLGSIGEKFTAMEAIAFGALTRIGEKIADVGMNMVKNLAIDPVMEGFNKYTASTKDVKAIMNQTGSSIEEVSEQVKELSWYSDATSYSYNAMVSAVKSFASQGIDVEDAIPAIMGLGNSLSYAGLAAEEASNGFNIYSKAMGQGYMGLAQWKSLNLMGASTAKLKEEYMAAAEAVGTLERRAGSLYVKGTDLEVTLATFDSTLGNQKGKWLTNDVMLKVLGESYGSYTNKLYEASLAEENQGLALTELMDKFDAQNENLTDAEKELLNYSKTTFLAAQEARTFGEAVNAVADAASSAWRAIFENIIGNAEEATELWSDFSEIVYGIFMGPTEGLANLTARWNELGGRTDLMQGLYNTIDAMRALIQPVSKAFGEVFDLFGEGAAANVANLTKRFREWSEELNISDELLGKIGRTSEFFAKILKSVWNGFKSIAKIGKDVISVFSPLISVVGNLVSAFAQIGLAIADNFNFGFAEKALNGISSALEWLSEKTEKLSNFLNGKIRSAMITAVVDIKKVGSSLRESFSDSKLSESIRNISNSFSGLGTGSGGKFAEMLGKIKTKFDELKSTIAGKFEDILENMPDTFDRIAEFVDKAWGAISNFGNEVKSTFAPVIEKCEDILDKLVEKLKSLKDTITTALSPVIETITTQFEGLKNSFSGVGENVTGGLSLGLDNGLSSVLEAAANLANRLLDKVKEIFGINSPALAFITIGGFIIAGLIKGLLDGTKDLNKTAEDIFGPGGGGMADTSEKIGKKTFAGVINTILNAIVDAIDDGIGMIVDAAGRIVIAVATHVGTFATDIFNAGADLVKTMSEGFESAFDVAAEAVAKLITHMITTIGDNLGSIITAGKEAVRGLLEGVDSEEPTFLGKVADLAGSFLSEFAELAPEVAGNIADTVVAMANAITENTPKVLESIGGLIHEIAVFVSGSTKDDILTIIETIGDIILAWTLATLPTFITKLGKGITGIIGQSAKDGILGGLIGSKKASGLTGFVDSISGMFRTLSSSLNNLTKSAPGEGIKNFATALLELAAALWILSKINAETIKEPLETTGIALAALAGGSGLLGKLMTDKDAAVIKTVITALAGAFKEIGIGIVAVAAAAKLMEGVDNEAINQAVLLMSVSVDVITLLARNLLKKFDAKQLESFPIVLKSIEDAFLKIGASLVIFGFAAKIMNGTDIENITLATALLGGIVAAMTILGSAATDPEQGDVARTIATMSKSFQQIAVASIEFGAAAKIMEGVDLTTAKNALLLLTAVVSAMSLLANAIADSGGGDVAGTIASMGKMFASLGVGLLAFVAALAVLSVGGTAMITAAVAALDLLMVALVSLAEPLKNLLLMLVQIICETVVGSVGEIVTALGEVLTAIWSFIMDWAPTLLSDIFKILYLLFNNILSFVTSTGPQIIEAVFEILSILAVTVFDWVDDTSGHLFDMVVSVLEKLIDTLKRLLTDLGDLVVWFGEWIWSVVSELTTTVLSGFGTFVKDLLAGLSGLVSDLLTAINDFIDDCIEAFGSFVERLIQSIGNLAEVVVDAIVEMIGMVAYEMGRGVGKIASALLNLGNKFMEGLREGFGNDEEYDGIGSMIVDKLKQGIINFAVNIKGAATKLWEKFKGAFEDEGAIESPSKKMMEDGKYIVQGLAKGIDNNTKIAESSAKDLFDGMFSFNKESIALGSNFSLFDGSKVSALVDGIKNDSTLKNIKDGFVDIISEYGSEGINEGFAESFTGAFNASKKIKGLVMPKSVTSKIKSAVKKSVTNELIDALNSENITITPVLDLSEIQNGSNRITDLLNSAVGKNGIGLDLGSISSNLGGTDVAGTVLNFTQNNYSPKELSRIDIYRQTNNQLSLAKGVL